MVEGRSKELALLAEVVERGDVKSGKRQEQDALYLQASRARRRLFIELCAYAIRHTHGDALLKGLASPFSMPAGYQSIVAWLHNKTWRKREPCETSIHPERGGQRYGVLQRLLSTMRSQEEETAREIHRESDLR